MAVKIRLRRVGRKKAPVYRIVVADSKSPRDGKFIEQIGTYDPSKPIGAVKLDQARFDHWVGVGAQPSTRVRQVVNQLKRAAAKA